MTILERHGPSSDSVDAGAAWAELVGAFRTPEEPPAPEPRRPTTECHWVPDPAVPGRLMSVWTVASDA